MRINFYAGAGAGKSTVCPLIFSKLKILGYNVELVTEYVKSWAIQKKPVNPFDQVYLLGKQMQYEYRFLSNSVDHIVTDSPVLLSACYAGKYFGSYSISDPIKQICKAYENEFPSINIFLDRKGIKYQQAGRYNSLEEAKNMDNYIKEVLRSEKIEFETIPTLDTEAILGYITEKL